MTMDAYKLLYKSGVSFDAKVSAESAIHDNELDDLQKQIAELNAEKQKITDDLEMANTIYDKVQRMDIKQQDSDVEIDHLKKSNQQIKTLLKFMNELWKRTIRHTLCTFYSTWLKFSLWVAIKTFSSCIKSKKSNLFLYFMRFKSWNNACHFIYKVLSRFFLYVYNINYFESSIKYIVNKQINRRK